MQLGNPPAVKKVSGVEKGGAHGFDPGAQNTDAGSPTGTVSPTSPPCGLGVGAEGSWNARLSFELAVNRSPLPAEGAGTAAEPVWVLQ